MYSACILFRIFAMSTPYRSLASDVVDEIRQAFLKCRIKRQLDESKKSNG